MEDVLVIGGGPAGAACALWSHQLGMKTVLLEKNAAMGGQGLQRRTPYTDAGQPALPGLTGEEVAAQLQAQLTAAGVACRLGFNVHAVRREADTPGWQVSSTTASLQARYVVIATGAVPRCAAFTEDDHLGTSPGTSMERINLRGRRVAMLGGGDNAFHQALFAMGRGAQSVDIYCQGKPRAQMALQMEMPLEQVHIGPYEVEASRMTVNGIHYDVIGVQYGLQACLPADLQVPLRDGYVDVDRSGSVLGHDDLFAAGEVTNYWHPCTATAFAHGTQVAKSIQYQHLSLRRAGPAPSVEQVFAVPTLQQASMAA